jgi:uncharacterized protein involved in type VI secretion and phage assembly
MQMPGDGNGIVIGIVKDIEDEEGLGRVKVAYPHLGDEESDWARLATPMAGPQRGLYFRPDVRDEVLVAFEQGDPRRPYILGSLWSQEDQPPSDDGRPSENNWRFIRSRSGHIILLDDTPGQEKIELIDKDGQRRIVIDSANRKVRVVCESGEVEVKAATGNVTVEGENVTIKARGTMNLEATGAMTIKGLPVNIN